MPTQNIQETKIAEAPVAKSKSNKKIILLVLGIVIFLFILLIGITIATRKGNGTVSSSSVSSVKVNKIDFQQVSDIPQLFNNKLYFADGNIFVLNTTDISISQITNFPTGAFVISHLKVINSTTIGYLKCNPLSSILDCTINTYNINTSTEKKLKTIDKSSTFLELDFIDEKSFVYAQRIIKQDLKPEVDVVYNTSGEEKTIWTAQKEIAKRDETADDFISLQLSFDKQKVMFTHTFLNGVNNNIYVFTLAGNEVYSIFDSVQPAWLDNGNILSRSVPIGYFNITNLSTKISTRINNIQRDAYKPKVLGNRVIYTVAEELGKVYLYDFTNESSKLIADNAIDAKWASNNEIVLYNTVECLKDCLFKSGFQKENKIVIKNISLKNIDTNEVRVFNLDFPMTWDFSGWNN